MDKKLIRRVVLLGLVGIVSILLIQAYLLYKNFDNSQKEFDQQVRIALLKVAKNLAKYNASNLPTQNLIKRISPSYYVVNIDDRIDANVLEYYLHKELEDLSLIVDFEYAIYDCATDAMLYGDYCTKEESHTAKIGGTDLPKYNEFIYYFGVRFPNRKHMFLSDPSLALLMGAILLLTIFLFGYSLYVILRQQRVANMQRDFINNMTHEFKTPLSSIKIATEALKNNPLVLSDKRLLKYSNIIYDQNERLSEQVIRVLEMARLEKAALVLKKKNTDIIPILNKIIQDVSGISDDVAIRLDTDLSEAKVMLDLFHFQNVMNNLLDNAINYNTGHKEITIVLRKVKKAKFALSITDNGIGINKENLERVFEKYYRVPTGNIHNVKGFGLGLYYVKQVIEAHQWHIGIKSKLHQGTTITIIM